MSTLQQRRPGLWGDILHYLKVYRRWWMIPMVLVFLLFGALLVVSEVAPLVSPFIYTLF